MRKIKYVALLFVLAILVACGSSAEKQQAVNDKASSGGIQWAEYNMALKAVADNGKYMLVYFWRDG